jgi:hypothetical protein
VEGEFSEVRAQNPVFSSAYSRTSEKPKKAKFRDLQNSHAHLPFVDGEEFIGGVTIVEMRQEREEHV